MTRHGENFSPILKQPVEHVGGEEGRGRVEGFAEGVANPAGFADGLDEDGKGDAADKVAFRGLSFSGRCRILAGSERYPVNRVHEACPMLPLLYGGLTRGAAVVVGVLH